MPRIHLSLCAVLLSTTLPLVSLDAQTRAQGKGSDTPIGWGKPHIIYQPTEGWQSSSQQDDLAYAQGVSGHASLQLPSGELLMLGGCNFPDKPAAEGGAKRFYANIYLSNALPSFVGKADNAPPQPPIQWVRIGSLPQSTAYAGHAVYQGRLIIVGGQSTGGTELDAAYAISRDSTHTVLLHWLPPLPAPRSSMACAVIGSRLYVVGGSERGRLTNSVLSLDLEHTERGWQHEAPYPGSPRLKVLATSAYNADGAMSLYLWGVFAHSEGEQAVSESPLFVSLSPKTGKWTQQPMPSELLRNGSSFGGGLMLSPTPHSIILAGGVQTLRFLPALARGQAMRRAKRLADTAWLEKLSSEAKTYLLQPAAWYGFGTTTLYFDTKTGLWSRLSNPALRIDRADASYANGWLIGGELKPGIRTPQTSLILFRQ